LFATMFGIILTDCYLAYNLHNTHSSSATRVSYPIFLGRLCKQMCENDPQRLSKEGHPVKTHGWRHLEYASITRVCSL
jgi:hypothetical protein